MNKQQFLAISLLHGLYAKRMHFGILKYNSVAYSNEFEVHEENPARECCLPVCRPLSDLTKPITHNGETFVPMEKIELSQLDPDIVTRWIKAELLIFKNSLKLIEWHFDIAGLIEKGEAIDVNTLPENPYK